MNRKIIKLAFVTIVTLALSFSTAFAAVSTQFQINLEKYGTTFLQNEVYANNHYSKLMSSYKSDGLPKANDYPDYYGGAYLDDNGKLVIKINQDYNGPDKLTDTKNKIKNSIKSSDDDITYEQCKYSYKYLTQIVDKLSSIMANSKGSGILTNIKSYQLLDKENRIVVGLADVNNQPTKNYIYSFCDPGCLSFIQDNGSFTDLGTVYTYPNVNPGDWVHGIENGSLGYRAKKNGIIGFVTAGHVTSLNNTLLLNYNQNIAVCTDYNYSGSVDAAFCKVTDPNCVLMNSIYNSGIQNTTLIPTVVNPAVGTAVNKYTHTSGHSSGKIISTNAGFTVNGIVWNNLTSTDMVMYNGDSGGPCYTFNIFTNEGSIAGIVKCQYGNYYYYTKASVINSMFGLTPY